MKPVNHLIALLILGASFCMSAQAAAPQSKFQKNTVYGQWSQNLFADVAIVQGPHKTVYVAGMAAENPQTGQPDHPGDFAAQCAMAYEKIRHILKAQGADMNSIVRTTAYVTDMRYFAEYMNCQKNALGSAPQPPHTLLQVSQLAWPGLMVEVEVTAVVPTPP